jgi:hypothetical protein
MIHAAVHPEGPTIMAGRKAEVLAARFFSSTKPTGHCRATLKYLFAYLLVQVIPHEPTQRKPT